MAVQKSLTTHLMKQTFLILFFSLILVMVYCSDYCDNGISMHVENSIPWTETLCAANGNWCFVDDNNVGKGATLTEFMFNGNSSISYLGEFSSLEMSFSMGVPASATTSYISWFCNANTGIVIPSTQGYWTNVNCGSNGQVSFYYFCL